MDSQQIEELLDKYFAEAMSDDEQKDFELLLTKDSELKKAFDFEQRINKNITNKSSKEINAKVSKADRLFHETKKSKIVNMSNSKTNYKKIFSIAASMLLLAAAYFFITQDSSVQYHDQSKEYLAYLNSYENESLGKYALRGSSDEGVTLKDSMALALHESTNGSSEKAKVILQELAKRHPEDEEIKLYLAIQMFKLSEYTTAIDMLNPLVKSTNTEIKEEAEMTMAMATTVFKDNRTTSKKWLKKIANTSNHRHQEMASIQLEFFD